MSEEIPLKKLLTVDQAAAQLQVSRSIIYALIDQGKLTCLRIGIRRGTIRIDPRDLDIYLDSCREQKSAEAPPVPRRTKLKHIHL